MWHKDQKREKMEGNRIWTTIFIYWTRGVLADVQGNVWSTVSRQLTWRWLSQVRGLMTLVDHEACVFTPNVYLAGVYVVLLQRCYCCVRLRVLGADEAHERTASRKLCWSTCWSSRHGRMAGFPPCWRLYTRQIHTTHTSSSLERPLTRTIVCLHNAPSPVWPSSHVNQSLLSTSSSFTRVKTQLFSFNGLTSQHNTYQTGLVRIFRLWVSPPILNSKISFKTVF